MIDDARLLTAAALFVIGGIVIWFALLMWRTHPVNRVFMLGPYVTEEGLRLILSNWLVVFTLGMTAFAEGFARVAYWAMRADYIGSNFANIFGVVEAILTTWAAICTAKATASLWHKR